MVTKSLHFHPHKYKHLLQHSIKKYTVDQVHKLPWRNGFQIYKNQQSLEYSQYQPQRQSWPKRKLQHDQNCDY